MPFGEPQTPLYFGEVRFVLKAKCWVPFQRWLPSITASGLRYCATSWKGTRAVVGLSELAKDTIRHNVLPADAERPGRRWGPGPTSCAELLIGLKADKEMLSISFATNRADRRIGGKLQQFLLLQRDEFIESAARAPSPFFQLTYPVSQGRRH